MKSVIVYVMAVVLTANWAGGAILDQSQVQAGGYTSISDGTPFAQTFTAGISGQLDHIDICARQNGDQGYPTTVSIFNVSSGIPSGSVLGSVGSYTFGLGWNSVSFLSQSVMLTAGTRYAIVLVNNDSATHIDPTMYWMIKWDGDTYNGGNLWRKIGGTWYYMDFGELTLSPTDADACFRTYMVPEPTAILLLGLGAMFLRKRQYGFKTTQ